MKVSLTELVELFAGCETHEKRHPSIGKYVLVRCRDAGVHSGVLESMHERQCVLTDARRLWYWKPAKGSAWLSGVAVDGLDDASKVGKPVERITLTENCEIIQCSRKASESIKAKDNYLE